MPTAKGPPASQLLQTPGALLNRTHLRELGLAPAGIDAAFRALPNYYIPGYTRPHVKVEDYLAMLEKNVDLGDTRRLG